MGKYKRYKNRIAVFLSGEKGQRFFNFAYSIGAAVVIWGALFKILHLPGGNALLSIGMGTEVLMFVLTAFDRPPKEYHWEEVFPVLASKNPDDRPEFKGGGGSVVIGGNAVAGADGGAAVSGGGSVVVGGSAGGGVVYAGEGGVPDVENLSTVTEKYTEQLSAISEQMEKLKETTEALNNVSNVLLESYRAITDNSDNITESSAGYVEQMTSLNRNIAGLNTIYEIQLKSISSQLDNIDKVNKGLKDISSMYERSAAESNRYCEETQRMAQYMQQLNSVYAKMITAMTINMYNPAMGAAAVQQPAAPVRQQEPEHPEQGGAKPEEE